MILSIRLNTAAMSFNISSSVIIFFTTFPKWCCAYFLGAVGLGTKDKTTQDECFMEDISGGYAFRVV
jgi:hypothetical protein